MISNACPVIECIECRDAVIRDLVIEGNRENNDYIDGCRAGCIYEHRVQNIVIDNVAVHNFNGEGISIQTTKDCIIRNCTVSHCCGNGIHPGTGSHNVLVENCECFDNDNDGLFICWRVIQGTFRNNRFYHNHNSGINIGHKDTDNVFTGNEIFENDRWGVHFREETYLNAPHRCVFKENVFRDNRLNIAYFESDVEDIIFENNDFGTDGNEETLEHFEIASNAKVTVK